jgi:hypothetical protein
MYIDNNSPLKYWLPYQRVVDYSANAFERALAAQFSTGSPSKLEHSEPYNSDIICRECTKLAKLFILGSLEY